MSAELLEQLILVAHLLLSLAIIGLIMLQQGKGAEMGASFGAGASQTLFGSGGGGTVLTRITAWLVALFFVLSFGLAMIARNKVSPSRELAIPLPAESALDDVPETPEDRPPEAGDLPTVEEFAPVLATQNERPNERPNEREGQTENE